MFQHAQFQVSVAAVGRLPPETGREVAFAGRSNAGKSSAINAITGRKKLAFASKTPGRTQQINFFSLGHGRFLVDLPGYGFARAPAGAQRAWEGLVAAYLARRRPLQGVVMVMDARRPVTPLDAVLLRWLEPASRPVHVLLAKADKLSRAHGEQQLERARRALQEFALPCSVQLFSSLTGLGVAEARGQVARMLEGVSHPHREPARPRPALHESGTRRARLRMLAAGEAPKKTPG
jgi:GTP-binding protein